MQVRNLATVGAFVFAVLAGCSGAAFSQAQMSDGITKLYDAAKKEGELT